MRAERFPERGATDLELFAQASFGRQPIARFQHVPGDQIDDLSDDFVAE